MPLLMGRMVNDTAPSRKKIIEHIKNVPYRTVPYHIRLIM